MDIPWVSVFWFIISALIVPAFVSYISSDYRVAQLQKRRDHYLKLLDSLKLWHNEIAIYAPTEQLSPTANEFTTRNSKALTELPYYEQLKHHLISGYPNLWKKWNTLDVEVKAHNNEYAHLMNEIASEIRKITEQKSVPAIFPYFERDRPRFYANLPKMALNVFSETKFRLDRYPDWYLCEPRYKNITSFPDGEVGHQWEQWGESIITHKNKDEGEKLVQNYKSLVDEGIFHDRIISQLENETRLEQERAEFSSLLKKEIEKVVLGDDLKGKCSICKQFSLL